MPRPQRQRRICSEPEYTVFTPDGIGSDGEIELSFDEYEVIRLVDYLKLTHAECSKQMNVSRTTVTEIYESARFKIAQSIINGRQLIIKGGNYCICKGDNSDCPDKKCTKANKFNNILKEKGDNSMRIAVTYDNTNGQIFQHFGHTEAFKVYTVEGSEIVSSQVISTNGQGHGALAGVLKTIGADVLICGGIGGGAQNALREAGVKLFGGVSGDPDKAVEALLGNSLVYNPNVKCNHHGDGHHHGNHQCGGHGEDHHHGDHKCGSHC